MGKKLFFGLGNPGERFVGTRHNVGVEVLQAWEEQVAAEKMGEVKLLYPTTFMNDSGEAVLVALRHCDMGAGDVVVVHDDLELPLGEVKFVEGGSAKGHNGVRSVHTALGTTEVPRVRLGIGRPPEGMTVHDFVLGRFTSEEQVVVEEMVGKVIDLLSSLILDQYQE